jgi:hypothetical protein
MDKFAGFITNVPPSIDRGLREVRVALIDDGIDKLQGRFGDSIIDGVSFYTSLERFDTKPYYFSSSGHGTLMARLIRRVCPKVHLYVARLDEGQSFDGSRQPTADSAAKVFFSLAFFFKAGVLRFR